MNMKFPAPPLASINRPSNSAMFDVGSSILPVSKGTVILKSHTGVLIFATYTFPWFAAVSCGVVLYLGVLVIPHAALIVMFAISSTSDHAFWRDCAERDPPHFPCTVQTLSPTRPVARVPWG